MIKRIIFDIDNTIMDFPKHYEIEYKKVIDKFNINCTPKQLYEAIGVYETNGKNTYYNKDRLLDTINNELNLNLDNKFIDSFFNMYDKLITDIPEETKSILKYLSNKYELVALSNWFSESQTNRLKCAGILKYFNKIYGTDLIPLKPNEESFIIALGSYKRQECLIVGDNLNIDIKKPYDMGINVLFLNKNNIKTSYPSINELSELKEML